MRDCQPQISKMWDRDGTGVRFGRMLTVVRKFQIISYIHLKFCRRAYLTPRIIQQMGSVSDPHYSHCSKGPEGTFIYVVQEYPGACEVWERVTGTFTLLLRVQPPWDPVVHLLNHISHLSLPLKKYMSNLAGRPNCMNTLKFASCTFATYKLQKRVLKGNQ